MVVSALKIDFTGFTARLDLAVGSFWGLRLLRRSRPARVEDRVNTVGRELLKSARNRVAVLRRIRRSGIRRNHIGGQRRWIRLLLIRNRGRTSLTVSRIGSLSSDRQGREKCDGQ